VEADRALEAGLALPHFQDSRFAVVYYFAAVRKPLVKARRKLAKHAQ